MKVGTRMGWACGVVFCCVVLCGLQKSIAQIAPPIAAPVAILKADAMRRSYRPGDVVVLKTTTTNVSHSDICFEPSSQAAFEVQLYNLRDQPGVDRVLLVMPEIRAANASIGICPTINPGKSEKRNIALNMPVNLSIHDGAYKILVGRREVGSSAVIWANPVAIRIERKSSAAGWRIPVHRRTDPSGDARRSEAVPESPEA